LIRIKEALEKPDPVKQAQEFLDGYEIYKFLGIKVMELKEGYIKVAFPKKEVILRPGGIIHGGFAMAIIDTVAGLAVRTVTDYPETVTVELKVNFLETMKGEIFTAIGNVIRKGRRVIVAEGEIINEMGKLCVKGIGTWIGIENKFE